MGKREEVILQSLLTEIRTLATYLKLNTEEAKKSHASTIKSVQSLLEDHLKLSDSFQNVVSAPSGKDKRLLFVRNLPESSSRNATDRSSADHEAVTKLLDLLEVECRPIDVRCLRLGSIGNRPRLLKIILPFPELVACAMRNCRNLRTGAFKGVFIRPDMSVEERDEDKKLREELRARRANGEDVLLRSRKIVARSAVAAAAGDLKGDSAADDVAADAAAGADDAMVPLKRKPSRPRKSEEPSTSAPKRRLSTTDGLVDPHEATTSSVQPAKRNVPNSPQ
ncbi:hypothetical protein QR680_009952 [Steinernema hermaphroditum]|uniref:Uncharacterized protein n=1 Tax=Steinernema hermaphroditum TaxID=289476 RepID=A0AA39IM79_9BILA|nr:hypothetical protein QR680_009952 [Steinernema hermaphroditum]